MFSDANKLKAMLEITLLLLLVCIIDLFTEPSFYNGGQIQVFAVYAEVNDTVQRAYLVRDLNGQWGMLGDMPPIDNLDDLDEKIRGLLNGDSYIKISGERVTIVST